MAVKKATKKATKKAVAKRAIGKSPLLAAPYEPLGGYASNDSSLAFPPTTRVPTGAATFDGGYSEGKDGLDEAGIGASAILWALIAAAAVFGLVYYFA